MKSPKVYVRDSGIVQTLLGLDDRDAVLGHPVAGGSGEGFVVENLLRAAPDRVKSWFYRTAAGAEIDLVLEMPGGKRWVVEIKRGLAPKLDRGSHHARQDLEPERSFVVYSGDDRYPRGEGVEAIGLGELAAAAKGAVAWMMATLATTMPATRLSPPSASPRAAASPPVQAMVRILVQLNRALNDRRAGPGRAAPRCGHPPPGSGQVFLLAVGVPPDVAVVGHAEHRVMVEVLAAIPGVDIEASPDGPSPFDDEPDGAG